MPDRSSNREKPRREDENEAASRILREATGEGESTTPENMAGEKNPAAVELGRLGGLKGGPARAKKLTKEQRSEIARKAAQARWKKNRDK